MMIINYIKKSKAITFMFLSLFYLSFENTHAETIPAIYLNNFKVGEAFFLSYKENSTVQSTWQEACQALNLQLNNTETGCFCVNNAGNAIWPKLGNICADGSFNLSALGEYCDEPYPMCPDDSWQLYAIEGICVRENECEDNIDNLSEEKLLAAIVYGEASTQNNFEEMSGIAQALIRAKQAWKMSSINELVKIVPRYTYVISNGNPRFKKILFPDGDDDYSEVYRAVKNALNYGKDYSNGGCFWDGVDLKMKGKYHYRYKSGFKFTKKSHNIFNIDEPNLVVHKGEMGSYTYIYESTAAKGKTIFWKYSKEFIKTRGAKQCV